MLYRPAPRGSDSRAIAGAIIALARELNLRVVAEGVETKEQLQFLRSRQCHEYQGYLCSRPAPPEAFAILMRGPGRARGGQALIPILRAL